MPTMRLTASEIGSRKHKAVPKDGTIRRDAKRYGEVAECRWCGKEILLRRSHILSPLGKDQYWSHK